MSDSKLRRVLIPGIFDFFHKGHKSLLKISGVEFSHVIVGVYTDAKVKCIAHSYTRNDERMRYGAVWNWVTAKKKQNKIEVQYLHDNEMKLFQTYKLTHIVCGKSYHLAHLFTDELLVMQLSKDYKISSLDILRKSHPLMSVEEVWIHNNCSKFIPKTKKMIDSLKIPYKKMTGMLLKKKIRQLNSQGVQIVLLTSVSGIDYSSIDGGDIHDTAVKILTVGCDGNDDKVYADILQYRFMDIIALPFAHDIIYEYEDFKIHIYDDQLQEGGYGKVYAASNTHFPNKSYVAKVLDVTNVESFQLECAISVRAGRNGYGPIVHAYFHCPTKHVGVVIMDRWEGDMDQENLHSCELEGLLNVVRLMHEDGIFHQDLYMRNILHRPHPSRHDIREFCIADYGLSFALDCAVPSNLRAADLVSMTHGLFDIDRMAVTDGICPNAMQKKVIKQIVSIQKSLTMQNWLTGIRWHLLNTVKQNGHVIFPISDTNLADVDEMYQEVFKHVNVKIPFSGNDAPIVPLEAFLSRLAYSDWLSKKRANELDENVISWYKSRKLHSDKICFS